MFRSSEQREGKGENRMNPIRVKGNTEPPCHAMVFSCMCTVAFSELSHVGWGWMDGWMDGTATIM